MPVISNEDTITGGRLLCTTSFNDFLYRPIKWDKAACFVYFQKSEITRGCSRSFWKCMLTPGENSLPKSCWLLISPPRLHFNTRCKQAHPKHFWSICLLQSSCDCDLQCLSSCWDSQRNTVICILKASIALLAAEDAAGWMLVSGLNWYLGGSKDPSAELMSLHCGILPLSHNIGAGRDETGKVNIFFAVL